jgi:hypothetical protein
MPRFKCTYTGTTQVGDQPTPCTFSFISDKPCLANVTPPANMSCAGAVLTGSEEIADPPARTKQEVAGGVLGGAVGVLAAVAIASGPPGWLLGGICLVVGAAVGAVAGS